MPHTREAIRQLAAEELNKNVDRDMQVIMSSYRAGWNDALDQLFKALIDGNDQHHWLMINLQKQIDKIKLP